MTEQLEHAQEDVDLEGLREIYLRERDRRLRSDGEAQYVQTAGDFASYYDVDPFSGPPMEREPRTADVDVLIVGAGHSGMSTAARLREAGVDDILIVDTAADFGGTWYWNRYPGAQCDVESYIYLPLLEETGYIPKEKYSRAGEIFEHAQRIAKTFDLYSRALFQTRVTEATWLEDSHRWRVRTNRGDTFHARFFVMAIGVADRAKLPGIPGLGDFTGRSFHTSRWDYDYTGGDSYGGLVGLEGKAVGVIGTGASAVQVIPEVAEYADHLYVFQRTPSSVDERGNRPTDPEWAASLKPGWQRARQRNFNAVVAGEPVEDLVQDMWTDIRKYGAMLTPELLEAEDLDAIRLEMELADARKMEAIRHRVDEHVHDPHAAEALKPWYRRLCKRPCFHDGYLTSFNRDNVTLVDVSDAKGVERIVEDGVIANGHHYRLDCIVFATGFEITTGMERRIDMQITGRDGTTLLEHWSSGLKTFHGYATHGFPNYFYVGASQNGISPNFTSMLVEIGGHVAWLIARVLEQGATRVEPTAQAEAEWVGTVHALSVISEGQFESCTPGTFTNEGQSTTITFTQNIYSPGTNAFNDILEAWRTDGSFQGLELGR